MKRREFWNRAGASLLLPGAGEVIAGGDQPAIGSERDVWRTLLIRTAGPVIKSLAAQTLKKDMPVETRPGSERNRALFTHLEAIGRTLAGIAPWLGAEGLSAEEETQRAEWAGLVRQGLGNVVDAGSPDRIDFTAGAQCLVDAAFLALGLLRAPAVLWQPLDDGVKQRLIAALQSTRKFTPGRNNWLLFSATVEAFLASAGAQWLPAPIETAVAAHMEWYKGDGAYGDGPEFHWDYYNSFVIQPMLLAVLDAVKPVDARWEKHREAIEKRARRYAAVQERVIAPDGSYPALGRSITYRCGAFHHLAEMALRRALPEGLAPAQVRCALAAVIQRTLGARGTFDTAGWLQIGLAGHQPSIAEVYISTGSLYLCTNAFLPLGLPPADAFWSSPPAEWTSRRIWNGQDLPPDAAL